MALSVWSLNAVFSLSLRDKPPLSHKPISGRPLLTSIQTHTHVFSQSEMFRHYLNFSVPHQVEGLPKWPGEQVRLIDCEKAPFGFFCLNPNALIERRAKPLRGWPNSLKFKVWTHRKTVLHLKLISCWPIDSGRQSSEKKNSNFADKHL